MSLFSNTPGSLKNSSVSGSKKNIPTSHAHLGSKKATLQYIKIIHVELTKCDGKPKLGLISYVKNLPSSKNCARLGKKTVYFPSDVEDLEKLHDRYHISPELERSILRQM